MLQRGMMMDRPLLISGIIEQAAAQFGGSVIVSRGDPRSDLPLYLLRLRRARSAAGRRAAQPPELNAGDAVGSIAWNNHRHLESYYAVSGSGMVMHTCNPRLHPDQLIYIINHAEDRIVLFDATFVALIQGIAPHCPKVEAWVALSDAANMPAADGLPHLRCYEELIAGQSDRFEWPGVRRTCRRRAVLHLRHDRKSQGRPVFAPQSDGDQRHRDLHAGNTMHFPQGSDSSHRSHVPHQRLNCTFPMPHWSAAPSWCCPARAWTARPCTN